MSDLEVFFQQIITGLSNGMIIAMIALGYTMVYGIVELINFAHGDLFMLGSFFALTLIGVFGVQVPADGSSAFITVLLLVSASSIFCAVLNWLVERWAYKPLRSASRLAPLVSAIGVSFIFINIGLFWGGLPMEIFSFGSSAAAPKDFPMLISPDNLLTDSALYISAKEVLIFAITLPAVFALSMFIKFHSLGRAMRAVAQNPQAALLMGIPVDRIISITFLIGGGLAGAASVVYALYNNTIYFQMGFRVGLDAFTAAVLGGIGSLPGAMLGGLLLGFLRSMSDQYLAAQWTNMVVFLLLVVVLVFRPNGILGSAVREKA